MQHTVLSQLSHTTDIPWSQRIADSALNRYSLAESQWHYKHGLLFKGVFHLWERTRNPKYWDSLLAYVNHYITPTGEIKTYTLTEYNIDQINAGKLLFPIYRETGQECYKTALCLLRDQLRTHPRTQEGGFWHKKIYPYQRWLDGIYMGMPFLAEFAKTFDEPALFDDLAFQIISLEQHTRDPQTGLLYHGWDESRQMPWANLKTGCSPHFWSRAIGWYAMAIADVLDDFPPDHPSRGELIAILHRTLTAVASFQDAPTGLWWQILDQGTRPGNYLEASGTSMFVYAIAKGVRKGYLTPPWIDVAQKGFKGLLDHLVTVDDAGTVDLHGICSTAGLGGNPYRDGSFEYYVGEPIITNDLHGVGSFLLAAIEMEKQESN
ncbi:MAG: glycoside hydrolase family 88 protein [Anaerolineales bacterium]